MSPPPRGGVNRVNSHTTKLIKIELKSIALDTEKINKKLPVTGKAGLQGLGFHKPLSWVDWFKNCVTVSHPSQVPFLACRDHTFFCLFTCLIFSQFCVFFLDNSFSFNF